MTGETEVIGIVSLLQYYNGLAKGILGWVFLCVIMVFIFFGLKEYDTVRAFLAASVITFLFSIGFYVMDLITGPWLITFAFLACITGLAAVMQNASN